MPGHVLIIDALSNRRIQLRAHLDTAAYAVDLAETRQDGLKQIRQDAPDVVIVADDLPDLRLRQFCKALRAHPKTQLSTIVVAVAAENHSARVSALIAGAHDVIDYRSDPADLRARLRSFMRIRHSTEDTHAPMAAGLAEAPQEFTPPTHVTFVASDDLADVTTRMSELAVTAGFRTEVLSPQAVHRTPNAETDVYVLFETGASHVARDVLGALLSHPDSRHSSILFVTDAICATASPLDLGAHDQMPLAASPMELTVRIRRLARRKQTADRARKATTELGVKAYKDALTGLNNRTALEEYLAKTDRALAEHPRPFAVMIVDLDHFKAINDNHGHAAGDDILAHIATILASNLRDGDFIARYGGEEFLIVLPDVGPGQARSVAQRLRNKVASDPKAVEDGTHVRATISIGVAVASRTERLSTKDLSRAADNALYLAKANGRNRIEIATQRDAGAVSLQRIKNTTRQIV